MSPSWERLKGLVSPQVPSRWEVSPCEQEQERSGGVTRVFLSPWAGGDSAGTAPALAQACDTRERGRSLVTWHISQLYLC